jgi:hypothetical protein
MHSHLPRCEPRPGPAGIRRRLAGRAKATTAPFRQARHRTAGPWAGPEADLLSPGRAPEESYRDYLFRTSLWP